MRAKVPADKLEEMFRKGNYDDMMDVIPWPNMEGYLQEAVDALNKTIDSSAALTRESLPAGIKEDLRLDTKNDAISDYLNTRTGAMIEMVKDDTQVMVQQAVRGAFSQGMTPRNVADQIKDGIGLNSQQAQQYQNFRGTKGEKAALLDRLTDYRAMTVARTEISFAANQGQLAVWKAGQDQGLIDDDAKKVWAVDGSPCPKICDPMDGVEAGLDEDFLLPDGVTVPAPPAHPRCRCKMLLNIGDNPKVDRENFKDGADKAEGEGDEDDDGLE